MCSRLRVLFIYRTRTLILQTQRNFGPCNAGVSRCLNLDNPWTSHNVHVPSLVLRAKRGSLSTCSAWSELLSDHPTQSLSSGVSFFSYIFLIILSSPDYNKQRHMGAVINTLLVIMLIALYLVSGYVLWVISCLLRLNYVLTQVPACRFCPFRSVVSVVMGFIFKKLQTLLKWIHLSERLSKLRSEPLFLHLGLDTFGDPFF